MYYLQGKDILCGLYLQKSMGDAFYVEYNYFFEDFSGVKKYPTHYESDLYNRLPILSKDTILDGSYFMDAMIEYELYTKEELEPYFYEEFDKYIMPPIVEGKAVILKEQEYYLDEVFPQDLENVLKKLKDPS